ncbi:MAG: nucleotidyl transferase AbiEii/AbiGii toxin family protein [Oligoflexales bacterium]|nr:nucleotidyl transferase AbiEii/AbiGii toxin family protein [Oligoflexales bacterium]
MNQNIAKAIEQSTKEKVKVIAKKQERTFNDVWQEVVLERWLARLAISPYKKNFIFKGAMCLLRYIDLDRETRDLDFLIKDLTVSIDEVKKYLSEVSALTLNDGFNFENLDVGPLPHAHMKYPGYQVSVIGKLGNTKTKVFIDIGVGDAVKPTEITMKLLGTEKAPLFEKEISLWAYPVESIFAEKLETAVARADQNSRMKDYHDLILLIRNDILEIEKLKIAIKDTFANRETKIKKLSIPNDQKENIQKYWNSYLKNLNTKAQLKLPVEFKFIVVEINKFIDFNNLCED